MVHSQKVQSAPLPLVLAPDAHFDPIIKPHATGRLANVSAMLTTRILSHVLASHDPVVFASHVKYLVGYIRHRHLRAFTESAITRRYMRRLSRGNAAYELALLDAVRALAQDDEQLSAFGYNEDVLRSFVLDHERQLAAYLNIAGVLSSHEHIASTNALVGTYQELVVLSDSVLSCLSALVRKIGPDELSSWVSFLRSAVVADLASLNIGADKVHLMFVLQELKNFATLNTLTSLLEKIKARFGQRSPANLLLTSFDLIEEPIATLPKIETHLALSPIATQILFLQDYRNVFGALPEHVYSSADARANVKSVLQRRIDHLVYTEEE